MVPTNRGQKKKVKEEKAPPREEQRPTLPFKTPMLDAGRQTPGGAGSGVNWEKGGSENERGPLKRNGKNRARPFPYPIRTPRAIENAKEKGSQRQVTTLT